MVGAGKGGTDISAQNPRAMRRRGNRQCRVYPKTTNGTGYQNLSRLPLDVGCEREKMWAILCAGSPARSIYSKTQKLRNGQNESNGEHLVCAHACATFKRCPNRSERRFRPFWGSGSYIQYTPLFRCGRRRRKCRSASWCQLHDLKCLQKGGHP